MASEAAVGNNAMEKYWAISNRVYGCKVEPSTREVTLLKFFSTKMLFAQGRFQSRQEPRVKQKEIAKSEKVKQNKHVGNSAEHLVKASHRRICIPYLHFSAIKK